MDLETVYVTYWNRLQHSVFLSFLLFASAVTTAFLLTALVSGHVSWDQEEDDGVFVEKVLVQERVRFHNS